MAGELDTLREYYRNCEFITNEGLECDYAGDGETRWHCTVEDRFCNPYGKAHGGFLFSIMDTAACSAASIAGGVRRPCVTLAADVHYTHSIDKGVISITGKVRKAGRTTGLAVAEIYNAAGVLCAFAGFDVFYSGADKD